MKSCGAAEAARRPNQIPSRIVFPAMRALLLLALLGVGALVGYNSSAGRDLFQLPGTPAAAVETTVRETVTDAMRDGVRAAAREASAEVKERAAAGVETVVNRAEEAVTSAALTSKIKAKMALDDLVKAADIDVDTDGSVVTLTGNVGSADERQRAVRIATETAGVTKVVDRLGVH
jgi:hyperosmotically inducible protein